MISLARLLKMERQHLLLLHGVLMLQWNCLLFCSISSTVQSSPLGAQSNLTCRNGYYYDPTDTSDGASCYECSVCSQGEGILQPCTNTMNTVCTQCETMHMISTFNASTGSWECKDCTNCTQTHRQETVACNSSANSVCGSCLRGYFLGVDRAGSTLCVRCSRCPPESDSRRVIRWRDCQAAGLDRNMWCSPGYVDSATTEQLQSTEPAARSPSLVTVDTMPITNRTANSTIESTPFVGDIHFVSLPDSLGDTEDRSGNPSASFLLIVSASSCFSLALLMCVLMGALLTGLKWRKCRSSRSSDYHFVRIMDGVT